MKTFRLTKITGLLLLLWLAYACSNDYDDYPAEEQQTPFTIGMAKTMYQQYVGNRARMKSTGENGDIAELTPGWDYATLASDTNWTVVESPLEFDGNRIIRMTTQSVGEQYAESKNPYAGMQQMSLVVMQHKKTQKTYAFTMFILPELDYLQANNNSMADRNSYLSRDVNLSGLVMFYNTEGQFVHGWKYENGQIVGYVAAGDRDDENPKFKPKSMAGDNFYIWDCYGVDIYDYNPDTGYFDIGSGVQCDKVYPGHTEFDKTFEDIPGGGGADAGLLEPIGSIGGGGGDSSTDTKDKDPEKRKDCDEKAKNNASDAENSLKASSTAIENIDKLRVNAKTVRYESGMLLNFSLNGYGVEVVFSNSTSQIPLYPNENTIYDVHTHPRPDQGYFNYTGFSVGDIYGAFDTSYRYGRFKGSIVIAYDGTEYLLAVNDREKLRQFWCNDTNKKKFESGDNTIFKDKKMENEYRDIRAELEKQGYASQEEHDYALSYLLDKYNTGLKISKKTDKNASFKEMKTTQDTKTSEYKPSICP